jgi:phosphohistidine phosphatase
MKRLMLLRHGLAARPLPGQGDFERNLTETGKAQANWLADNLREHSEFPECLLCSSAQRARQTWTQIANQLDGSKELPRANYRKELYLAAPDRLLRLLQELPESCKGALLVGHNPGLHLLAAFLAGPESDAAALKSLRSGLPEAGLCIFSTGENDWQTLGRGSARLLSLHIPPH